MAEIKKAYRGLVLQFHPDKNIDSKTISVAYFQEIVEAYKVLSNPLLRQEYDTERYLSGFSSKQKYVSPILLIAPLEKLLLENSLTGWQKVTQLQLQQHLLQIIPKLEEQMHVIAVHPDYSLSIVHAITTSMKKMTYPYANDAWIAVSLFYEKGGWSLQELKQDLKRKRKKHRWGYVWPIILMLIAMIMCWAMVQFANKMK